MKNPCHKVGVDPLLHCSSTAFQSRSFYHKIFQQDFTFFYLFIFFVHPLAPMNGLTVCGLIYLVYLFFSYLSYAFTFLMKLVLLFTLCIPYKQSNLQAKITAQIYYRAYFTQQSKIFCNSKSGLLFFLKLQNYSLH